jgi:hypothetical protein
MIRGTPSAEVRTSRNSPLQSIRGTEEGAEGSWRHRNGWRISGHAVGTWAFAPGLAATILHISVVTLGDLCFSMGEYFNDHRERLRVIGVVQFITGRAAPPISN